MLTCDPGCEFAVSGEFSKKIGDVNDLGSSALSQNFATSLDAIGYHEARVPLAPTKGFKLMGRFTRVF